MRLGHIAVLVLVAAGCGSAGTAQAPTSAAAKERDPPAEPPRKGDRIKTFVLDRADTAGKVTVPSAKLTLISFFATFCMASRVWLPKLEALQQRYASRGLAIVGVSSYGEDDASSLVAFARGNGATFPVVLGAQQRFTDFVKPLQWQSIIIVDRTGVVQHTHVGTGEGAAEEIDATVKRLLDGMPDAR